MRPQIRFEKEQYAQIEKLAAMGCTDEEMAAVMGVSNVWRPGVADPPRKAPARAERQGCC
jgi:hypothetical protein